MTVEKRMTKSISKQTTTAAKPFEFYLSWEGTEVVDFKGKVFPSKAAMCRAYGISVSTYTNRRKAGWTQEKALTTPARKGRILQDSFRALPAAG